MPNWVKNCITLEGDEKRIAEMKEAIKADEIGLGTVDFNKLIPMPKELEIVCGSSTNKGLQAYKELSEIYQIGVVRTKEELLNIPEESEKAFLKYKKNIDPEDWKNGRAAYRNLLKYGYPTWYEWSLENWGTKWNSCGYEKGVDYNTEDNKLEFDTAWSAPHPILQKLSEMYPDIHIKHEWADEGYGENCGTKEYYAGKCEKTYYPDTGKAAFEFALDVWGMDMEEFDVLLNIPGTDYIGLWGDAYELIRVCDKYALFTNNRITEEQVPQGMYFYHLRHTDDNERIGSIEKNVQVNHAGSVITKEPIDLGANGCITFDKETEPNFIGKEMVLMEYLENYEDLDEIENQAMGEIKQ